LTKRTGQIRYVNSTVASRGARSVASERAKIRLLDKDGAAMAEFPAQLREETDVPADSDRTASVDEVLPVSAAVAALVLVLDDAVLDTRVVSRRNPTVNKISAPRAGPGDANIAVTWKANDPDPNARLTYAVQLSNDGGATWETIAVGLTRRSIEIGRKLIVDPANARLRIIANDGVRSSSRTVTLPR
jgi:hypothetical protein